MEESERKSIHIGEVRAETGATVNIAGGDIIQIQAGKPPMSAELAQRLTEEYLRTAASRWAMIEAGGVEAPLKEIYCMLEAVKAPPAKPLERRAEIAPLPKRRDAAEPFRAVSVGEALFQARRLVLLGVPGAGKSTTEQFIGYCFASPGEAQARLGFEEASIPVRLELRGWAGEELEQALARQVNALLRRPDAAEALELVHLWRDRGQLLALLDGLDEVPDRASEAVRREIQDFAASAAGQKCRLIVSARLTGYKGLGSEFEEYTIKPFITGREALPYLTAWLKILKPEWAEQAGQRAAGLASQLESQPSLRLLMDNPLILRLAAEVFAKTGAVPENRAGLYQHYIDIAWKRAEGRGAQEREKTLAALEELAWQLQTGQALSVDEAALKVEREKLGMVVIVNERLAFSHTTFQEYFAALRLKRAWEKNWKWAWEFIQPRLHLAIWREPLLLLAGMLAPREYQRLVTLIVKANSDYEHPMCRDLNLAVKLAGEHRNLAGPVIKIIARQAGERLSERSAIFLWLSLSILAGCTYYIAFSLAGACAGGERWLDATAQVGVYAAVAWWLACPWAGGQLWRRFPLQSVLAENTIRALKLLRAEEAVAPLKRALLHRDSWLRTQAVEALKATGGPSAVKALIGGLKNSDASIRYEAAKALGEMGDLRAIGPLSRAEYDWDQGVRQAASLAKFHLKDKPAARPVQKLPEDHWLDRASAEGGIVVEPEPDPQIQQMIQDLKDPDRTVRRTAACELESQVWFFPEQFSSAAGLFIAALGDEDNAVRSSAANVLGAISSKEAAGALAQALQDVDPEVRAAAAGALEMSDDPITLPALLEAATDPDQYVRMHAIKALGRNGGAEGIPILVRALKDENKEVRRRALESLGSRREAAAFQPLLEALKDPEREVRQAAAGGLAALGNLQAVTPLIEMLEFSEPEDRIAAADALGKLGSTEAIQPLARAMQQKTPDILRIIKSALGIGRRFPASDVEVSEAMVSALEKLLPGQELINGYQDPFARPPRKKLPMRTWTAILWMVLVIGIGAAWTVAWYWVAASCAVHPSQVFSISALGFMALYSLLYAALSAWAAGWMKKLNQSFFGG